MENNEIEDYLKKNRLEYDQKIYNLILERHEKFISINDVENANLYWKYKTIYIIKKNYIETYNMMKNKKFDVAWINLEQLEHIIFLLFNNFSLKENEFFIKKIRNNVFAFQELYPYNLFGSREAVILKEKCSICGNYNTIRSHCGHEIGKLYCGQICQKIVEKIDLKAISIVRNPMDKYCVLTPQGKDWNYTMVEMVINKMITPYEEIRVEIKKILKPQYKNLGRNDKCACGSNIKYKKCCFGTSKELMDHKIVIFNHKDKNEFCGFFNSYKN